MNKNILISLLVLLSTAFACAQEPQYQLSSHILDISKGLPASDVKIELLKQTHDNDWTMIAERQTDKNGRVSDFLQQTKGADHSGVYKLTFYVAPYFKRQETDTFYPYIDVVFEIEGDKHYHVPITLSAFGYSTYRGN